MATRSVVGFIENGNVMGTYVHYDGYPSYMVPTLQERLETEGYEALTKWIMKGIHHSGYRSASSTTPFNDKVYNNCKLNDEEYGYLVTPDGILTVWDQEETTPTAFKTTMREMFNNYKNI